MSEEKEKKHHHHHHHDAEKQKGPTAGPSEDDRGGDPQLDQEAALRSAHVELAHDRSMRIIGLSIEGGRTTIMLGGGLKHGVTEGMYGYIPGAKGMLAEFYITHVTDTVAKASVDLIPDMLREHDHAIVNPASRPPKPEHKDQKARILGVSIQGGKTRIIIGNGSVHGSKMGERGVVIGANGRKLPGGSFTLDDVGSLASHAFVELLIDELRDCSVILNPSD